MSRGDLTPNERGTVRMFGKDYHWEKDADGEMRLCAGPAPDETNLTMSELASLSKEK